MNEGHEPIRVNRKNLYERVREEPVLVLRELVTEARIDHGERLLMRLKDDIDACCRVLIYDVTKGVITIEDAYLADRLGALRVLSDESVLEDVQYLKLLQYIGVTRAEVEEYLHESNIDFSGLLDIDSVYGTGTLH